MGECFSKSYSYDDIVVACPAIVKWEKQLESFGISNRDIVKFFRVFMKITNEVDEVIVSDVVTYLDVDGGTFVAKLLTALKTELIENVKGIKIDFSEFILSIWSFCSIQTSSLRKHDNCNTCRFRNIFNSQTYFASMFTVNCIGI